MFGYPNNFQSGKLSKGKQSGINKGMASNEASKVAWDIGAQVVITL